MLLEEFITNKESEYAKKIQLIRDETEKLIDTFKNIFSRYPQLESISWNQGNFYNDEGYDFRIETDNFQINTLDTGYDYYYEDSDIFDYRNDKFLGSLSNLTEPYKAVKNLLESISKTTFRNMFSLDIDSEDESVVRVTITQDGISVDSTDY